MNPTFNRKALLKKNRKAQKEFFIHFYAFVMSISLRYAKSKEDADEILSDSFFKVFDRIHLFKPEYNIKSWIGKITVNTAIDRYRKDLKRIKLEPLDTAVELKYLHNEPFNIEEKKILSAINGLSERYRLVFNLYVFEGYSHKEISEKLEIAEGTSKSCLARARNIIKKHLMTSENKIHVDATGI